MKPVLEFTLPGSISIHVDAQPFVPMPLSHAIGAMMALVVFLSIRRSRLLSANEKQEAALTGYGLSEDKNSARQARFDAHLTKPAAVESLLALIAKTEPVEG